MWLILTFVVNSGLSFLLGLAVAAVLGPAEYGRFAIASLAAVVIGTLLFDWLRLSATRFYGAEARDRDPGLRASLDGGYLAAFALLGAAFLGLLALGFDFGLSFALLAVAAATAATSGSFEYSAALARALFLNRAYVQLTMVKNVLAFGSMVAAGLLFGGAAPVLGMFALSTAIATFSVRGALREPAATLSGTTRERLAVFARYGWPIVGANLAYQAIALANRVVATAFFGYAAGGQVSLATDVTIRLFLSAGAALDAYLFQVAVRRSETDGLASAHRQVGRNMVVVTAVLSLLAVGYATAMPLFEALFVPEHFRGEYGRIGLALVPGVLAFCLVQFGLSPVFQVAGRTAPILWAALAAAAVDLGLLAIVPGSIRPVDLAWVHSAALLASLAVVAAQAFRIPECRPRARDLGALLLASAAASAAIWPMRTVGPAALGLAGAVVAGTSVFGAVLIAFDVAGARNGVRSALGRLPRLWPAWLSPGQPARGRL